jgi:hypothetical protein
VSLTCTVYFHSICLLAIFQSHRKKAGFAIAAINAFIELRLFQSTLFLLFTAIIIYIVSFIQHTGLKSKNMNAAFLQLLEMLETEKVTVYYLEGEYDKKFGSSYSGTFISMSADPNDVEGLYYISELDMMFLRYQSKNKQLTRLLSIDKECQLPKKLIATIANVVQKKCKAVYSPETKPREIVKKPAGLKDEDRYLILRGKRDQSTAA